MSTVEAMSNTIEKLYAVDRIIAAFQKKPHDYGGISLHASEAHTLKLIGLQEGISQTELSRQMFRTNGATSLVVDKLVSRGLVLRTREAGNQRRYFLTLTELGRKVHEAHLAYDDEQALHAAEAIELSEEELQELSEHLDRFIAYYSNIYLKQA